MYSQVGFRYCAYLATIIRPARTNFSLLSIHQMQQGVARGYLARNAFRQVLRAHFKHGAGDLDRRRDFIASELGSCSRKLEKSLQRTDDDIEALFSELDQGLEYSRR